MSKLSITIIDVGWGDSILIESEDSDGEVHYALIDSNDTSNFKSSFIFIKRYFEKKKINLNDKPIFDFVMLSHAHTDHGQGLKGIMREFGTEYFFYPKSIAWKGLSTLIGYANRSSNVKFHQSIDNTKIFKNLGDVSIKVLWPLYNRNLSLTNENNNSIVLHLKLNDFSVLLTGDAEEEVWKKISSEIPDSTKFFKVPHHGSVHGTFDPNTQDSSYLDQLDNVAPNAHLAISSHISPYGHPDKKVLDEFDARSKEYYRTDEHYHISFTTDGDKFDVKYSRFL